ncbi:Pkinase-domain-containing protein [Byssothecium circinans]|uniref:Pkinase-domain-containing protein n=1 Tax=Byssothecium circinans TaxID=147558 RepID=A0A6A5U0Z4_9PLEO|nr:Pkinase-domain-containing protein [Byssothecium circinans]
MVLPGAGYEPVAYFEVRHEGDIQDGAQEDVIDIIGNKQFYLGRNANLCERAWPDPTISNRHLRVHCILYESDPIANIPPFVYATDFSTNGTYLKKSNEACASSQTDKGKLMGKASAFLLDDGDELRISTSLTLIYREIDPAEEVRLTYTQERERPAFALQYRITGRLLGAGASGKVLVAIQQKSQRQLACKVINLKGLHNGGQSRFLQPSVRESQQSLFKLKRQWPSQITRCFREFEILENLVHPNIVSVEKVFWSPDTIYIFQELCTGGDLFSFIEYKGGRLLDLDAAVIVRQILKGVEYLHEQNIVHRDLKPDNILMTSLEDGDRIVITDFGNARFLPDSQGPALSQLSSRRRMFTMVGTLEYAAPEIHNVNQTIPRGQGYSKAVDMWSIGAITTALLSGDVLFTDRAASEYHTNPRKVIMGLASKCDISVIDDAENHIWREVGAKAKDFIKNLLVLNENERMTVMEALDHIWFTNENHTAEFEALYERTTKHWAAPRRKSSKLVEAIPTLPTITEAGQTLSHHFAPPSRKRSASRRHKLFADSQHQTQNSLSSVAEEYEEADFEGPSHYEQQNQEENSSHSLEQRSSQFRSSEDEIGDSMKQLSLDENPPASGMYSAYESAQENVYVDCSNAASSDVDYEDEGESMQVTFPPGYTRREPESSIDHGTLMEALRFPPGYSRRRSSKKMTTSTVTYDSSQDELAPTYSPRRRIANADLESSIVYETSEDENGRRAHKPDSTLKVAHWTSLNDAQQVPRSREPELPSYEEFFHGRKRTSEASSGRSTFVRSKRMKLVAEYD